WAGLAAVLHGLSGQAVVSAAAACDPDVIQPNGAIYRFCLPPGWTAGDGLLVYGHGYVWFNEPLTIPYSHICFGEPGNETCVHDVVNDLGLAFAATSYPTNGLAVLPGVDDVVNLVAVFSATYGAPSLTLISGVSEGGLVTTLAVERHPEVFDGGLAACGPIGDWVGQINYFGDFRVLFDYFFPGIIPSEVITIPTWLIDEWSTNDYFTNVVAPVVFDPAYAFTLTQFLSTSHAPYLPGVTQTVRQALFDGLAYNIMATNEVIDKLGGNPFDNSDRVYSGSADDVALNAGVHRFAADPAALAAMVAYETTGWLERPLVTLHTSLDQQVPQWHEIRYREKVLANHTWMWHIDQPMPIDNYGHCNFDADAEVLPAFFALLGLIANPPQPTLVHLPVMLQPQ
ncbi:MAG: prolyl oligopeptidase family serine peptidase, partial [Chloroflexi bacterium]|nr:prolyl oligopeptidase family serine peptidase [Chloroflexota bacterium]